jgi:ribosomal protein L11 methyltransferase
MQWIHAKVIFEHPCKEFAADLISNIFYELGLQGVQVESPDQKPDEGWGEDAVEQPDADAVSGYFPENASAPASMETLENRLKRLETENSILTRVVCQKVDEEDWAESWKAYFWPTKVTERLVVKPTWRDYTPGPNDIVVEIDPGMAFGTGSHPTTGLCMEMIEKYLKSGDSFLDVGTGSGILMIAARKLGADLVWGVDNDELAVETAGRNLILNHVPRDRFFVMAGHLTDLVERRFDVAAANILSEVILVLLEDIDRVLKPGGVFICSGITLENRTRVLQRMSDQGFEILDVSDKEGWVVIVGTRHGAQK